MTPETGGAPLTLPFASISRDDVARVGGKGANLGELTRAGVRVPPGFCVTTRAYERFIAALPNAPRHLEEMDALDGADAEAARRAAEATRAALESLPMPDEAAAAVVAAWKELGVGDAPLAVRSSATAEDLPGASFAGQQDTYLNVVGERALLDAVRRCWISLFTDRAVLYRARGGFGQRGVGLAVVVQRMIDPDVSGILFTADPVSGHRRVASIDAGFGLGEALVGGLIDADLYRVDRRARRVILAQPGDKAFAIRAVPGGGTRREPLPEARRRERALSDAEVLALADVGDRIERHFGGAPQDIEWCIAGGEIYVVQARPITSLYPIPEGPDDGALRVYFSFGHLQNMLDAMPRLALETWRLLLPAAKGRTPTLRDAPRLSGAALPAGGHLFLDLTAPLRVPRVRRGLLGALDFAYPAARQSLAALASRDEFAAGRPHARNVVRGLLDAFGAVARRVPGFILVRDPAAGARALDRAVERLPAKSAARIRAALTPAARVRQGAAELNAMFSRVRGYVAPMVAGMIAHRLLARMARAPWASDARGEVDVLLRGLPGNVTTTMDLAVGDLTDLARAHPALARLLEEPTAWPTLRARLAAAAGGAELLAALDRFLERYGDRGAGEIDISRPRWRDDPSLLLRVAAGGLAAEPGAHRRQHEAQVAAGEAAAARLVAAARRGPWGPVRARWVRRLARVARAGLGLREHPKFTIVRLFGVVREQVCEAGGLLARRGQLARADDVWHLGYDELAGALDDASRDLRAAVARRAETFRHDQRLKPPIVISSEGETPSAAAREDVPAGALAGTGASAGVVEGVARVVADPQRETLRAGEILVARFTDPGWTPLFVHAAGVVTEVGGLMTHGAVVAREYGIPAVVSVAGATERIGTGQRIRVDGTRGIVEILDGA
ncbi:MAG: PEP/pyruvate-binding domain-containing protein [Gemmatimonadaceae bacterium]